MNTHDHNAQDSGSTDARPPEAAPASPCVVVGIGASAGGLEALRQLFGALPPDTGMAFVVVQHMDPERPSMLAGILATATSMPVVEARDGMPVEPDHVYVIPPRDDIVLRRGALALVPRPPSGSLPHLPIDLLFATLAEDRPVRVVGVVLSGSASDGTEGLKAIKAEGGITFAQEPASAQFRSMPESAVAAGVVDFCLPPEQIAVEIARLSRHPYLVEKAGERVDDGDRRLSEILALIRRHTGSDFTGYKRTTVLRRIHRRMALRQVATPEQYDECLRDDPDEVRALARDLLVHVTSFFRDPDAFEALKQHALAELMNRKGDSETLRIWVPGCSTGEEVYSIAICCLEALEARGRRPSVSIKIFGSDLGEQAIEAARRGVYTEAALAGVTPERLARFFERVDQGYQIRKHVRGLCIFVRHDVVSDPPFARLDLISCRNVLIYFDAELQRRLVPLLHQCLNRPGYLFLGRSEGVGGFRDLFTPLDRENKIFLKVGESRRVAYPLPLTREAEAKLPQRAPSERRSSAGEAQRQADHLLLARYAPPGVIVNDRLEIVQFRGLTGAFLEAPPGQPQMNVVRMAREGLAVHLHDALETARTKLVSVRKEGVQIDGSRPLSMSLEVVPLPGLPEAAERFFLIVFEERAPRAEAEAAPAPPAEARAPRDQELARLRTDLAATREYLQSLADEHQTTADDLATANEELLAANEELQSTNEELQSAKEELQSTNEELSTLNDELRNRNQDLDLIANDLANILDSIDIPILIVDTELRIRRFTPTVRSVANLLAGDVGRPLEDIKLKVRVDGLAEKIGEVMSAVAAKEWEVQREDGRWCRLRIRPYRTADNRLDGAILSFVDVDVLKRALREAEIARDYARALVETMPSALVVLDPELRVVSANHAYYDKLGAAPAETEGAGFFDLAGGAWRAPALQRAVAEAVEKNTRFRDVELVADLPVAGRKIVSVTGRMVAWQGGAPMLLLAIEDITDQRALEGQHAQLLESEKLARLEAERANRTKDLFLATLSHELRTPLSAILLQAQVLQRAGAGDARIQRVSGAIERAASNQARLIDDLLDISRIVSGKLVLDLGAVNLGAVVQSAVDLARATADAKSIRLDVTIDESVGPVYGDSARLQQVVSNLLNNSIKFTPPGGSIAVWLERLGGRAQITVSDTGMGIRADFLPHLFERFVQADSSTVRVHGGLGLGLAIVRHLVEVHGGEVHAESAGEGKGATFRVILPVGTVDQMPAAATSRASAWSIAGVRVLVVEDDEDARDALCSMLSELGAIVRCASSAAEGLAAVMEEPPQVILSDIAMPREDGYSFIRKVRALGPERGGQTPAAALTALAGEEDRKRALAAGFQMHIAKPLDAMRLASAVSLLAGPRAEQA